MLSFKIDHLPPAKATFTAVITAIVAIAAITRLFSFIAIIRGIVIVIAVSHLHLIA